MIKKYKIEDLLDLYGKSKRIDWRGFILKNGTIIEMGKYSDGIVHNELFYDNEIRINENLVCYNYRCGDLSLKMTPKISQKQFNVIMKNVFHDFKHRTVFIDIHYKDSCSVIKTSVKHNFSNNQHDKKKFEYILKGICDIERE